MPLPDTARTESTRGLQQLEGYLLAQSHLRTARAEAEAFAGRLPWLTSGQYEAVVELYTENRMALTRRVLEGTVEHCGELRQEYTARYEQLRRRLLCQATAGVLTALCASVFAVYLAALR